MGLLPVSLIAAELDPRAPFGFRAIHAGTLQIVSAKQDVGAKLRLHVIGDL